MNTVDMFRQLLLKRCTVSLHFFLSTVLFLSSTMLFWQICKWAPIVTWTTDDTFAIALRIY